MFTHCHTKQLLSKDTIWALKIIEILFGICFLNWNESQKYVYFLIYLYLLLLLLLQLSQNGIIQILSTHRKNSLFLWNADLIIWMHFERAGLHFYTNACFWLDMGIITRHLPKRGDDLWMWGLKLDISSYFSVKVDPEILRRIHTPK